MTCIRVAALWRYPVKSLQGEPLEIATFTLDGIVGDRAVHVAGPRGVLTGRTRKGLLTVPASTDEKSVVHVAGHRWDSPEAAAIIREHGGPGAHLVADDSPERFDDLNVNVATVGAVTSWGHDVRRLRPNLLLSGVAAERELQLPGNAIAIGDALIGVHSSCVRCVTTSIDPDTGEQDLDVWRQIRDRFDNLLALNCWVIRGGQITVGDVAAVVPTDAMPSRRGGWTEGAPYPNSAGPENVNSPNSARSSTGAPES